MFFWCVRRSSDIEQQLNDIDYRTEGILPLLVDIDRKLTHLMALVSIEQGDLDTIATTVSDVADALQAVIDNPNPLAPADETALKSAVEKLQAVGPKTAPVEPPVV